MEVQRVITESKTVISDVLKLTYNIYTKGNRKELVGEVKKEDEVIGRFNASNNGEVGFSLSERNALNAEEIRKISSSFFEDVINILEIE